MDVIRDPETGLSTRLDTTPAPITTDITDPAVRWRVYVNHEHAGWHHPSLPVRTWRELRLTHECAEHERKHESKRKPERNDQL